MTNVQEVILHISHALTRSPIYSATGQLRTKYYNIVDRFRGILLDVLYEGQCNNCSFYCDIVLDARGNKSRTRILLVCRETVE